MLTCTSLRSCGIAGWSQCRGAAGYNSTFRIGHSESAKEEIVLKRRTSFVGVKGGRDGIKFEKGRGVVGPLKDSKVVRDRQNSEHLAKPGP